MSTEELLPRSIASRITSATVSTFLSLALANCPFQLMAAIAFLTQDAFSCQLYVKIIGVNCEEGFRMPTGDGL